jgi:crossover junction endodeoxyribonuclease RuvC
VNDAAAVRILGVDPGTRRLGFGVIEASGSRLVLLECGVLAPPAGDPLERRLAAIAAGLRAIIARHAPAAVAVEDVFVKADPRAALAVGQSRGAVLAVAGEAGLPVSAYPPATVKRAVAGSGAAEKGRVGRMVAAILGLPSTPAPADASDALAVAITHALRRKLQTLTGK